VLQVAWRARWGVRVPVLLAGAGTAAAAVVMWVLRDRLATAVRAQGLPIPVPDDVVYHMVVIVYGLLGFVISLTVASPSVADDLRSGAFQFYFSRPIRARDYVLGKVLGLFLVVGLPMVGGPLALALVRLLMAEDWAQAASLSALVPKALLLGLVGTAAHVLPAAGLGALVRQRRMSQAAFAIYYLVVSPLAVGLADLSRVPWPRLASLSADMRTVGRALFGIDPDPLDPPLWAAAASLVALSGVALWIVQRRVRRAEIAGLGGGG
jgi:hypothetical protein